MTAPQPRRDPRRPTTTLWRPTGPEELALVRALDWCAEELDDFNAHLVGPITVTHTFR
ncbi:hypothetical protein ACFY9F_32020 [Streptomyces sp. NPDC012421]|uniref:hypothetical protein n=1 Tax=Streptomyces sp. NPDC012421 TaxID=3364832 RepID=UPI0036E80EE7